MNKNLKKVISTVAALALSASSFVALAATSFPDVADTATYSKAVNELVGLGIVNGYEDGTFGPDKLVTRAEITKMVVAAIGEDSAATAAANSDTKFTDVPATHWAAGYVTVGTDQGFINGMGDGTFAPDANVQFLQAVKMLVSACGYTTWAERAGGWPSGYSTYGSQIGISKGIDGDPTNSTELNRAQVAQVISNALEAPACVQDGYVTGVLGSEPNLVQKNGQGEDYQSLLIQKHDAYKVYGRVTGTKKSGAGVDSDEVKFDVEKADNFDGEYYKTGDTPETITAKIGDSNADEYLLEYAEAIIRLNEDDDWEIVTLTSTAKNEIVEFEASYFDDDNSNYSSDDGAGAYYDNIMYFFTDSNKKKTQSYKLNQYNGGDQDAVVYYVNGVAEAIDSKDKFIDYITDNENGTITLVDAPASGSTSTDGRYDYVMVSYYADAIVDDVTESTSTPKIYFDRYDNKMKASLTVDLDDEDTDYSFTLNGEEIEVSDITTDDVLSIAYDVTVNFDDSSFYDVLVSRDIVTGKVTSVSGDEGYLISGTYYEPNTSTGLLDDLVDNSGEYISGENAIEAGTEYTLYLNAFGKFVSYDEGTVSKNLAVLESMYTMYGNEWWVSVIDQTGTKTQYKIKTSSSNTNVVDVANAIYTTSVTDESSIDTNAAKNNYWERVYEYTINSSSEFTLKKQSTPTEETDEYSERSNKIGSVRLSDSTVVLDFTKYGDDEYGLMNNSSFVDESEYTVYGYSKSSANDNAYRFVIVDKGGSDLSGASSMAVYINQGSTTNSNDETAVYIKAYVDGEEQYLTLDTDLDSGDISDANLTEGTPFFYTLNSSDYVDELYPVLNEDASNKLSSEDSFRTYVFAQAKADDHGSFDSVLDSDFYDPTWLATNNDNGSKNFGTSKSKAYIHFGPVVDKATSSATIATITDTDNNQTNIDKSETYTYGDSVNVYIYDYYQKSGNKLEEGAKGSILKCSIAGDAWVDKNTIVDWDETDDIVVNYALLKVYDDDVTEALVITNTNN